MNRDLGFDRRQGLLVLLLGTLATAPAVAARLARRADLTETIDRGTSIPFTATVAFPSALADAAAGRMYGWLATMGWMTLAIGVMSVLALWADWAARSRSEIRLRRAVGASRGTLARVILGGSSASALVAALAGLLSGSLLAIQLASPWPTGPWPTGGVLLIAAAAAGGLALGAAFPLLELRRHELAPYEPLPPPLGIASLQLGVALALVVGGGILTRQAPAAAPAAPGRFPAGATIQRLDLSSAAMDSTTSAGLAELVAATKRPGTSVSLTSAGAHLGVGPIDELMAECGQCYVGGIFMRWRPVRVAYLTASADTFAAGGFEVLAGRPLADSDVPGAEPVAVVNQYLGRRYFQNGDPVGRIIYPGGRMSGTPYRVVGMVRDGPATGLAGADRPREAVYLSSWQHPSATMELVVAGPGRRPDGAGVGAPVPVGEALRRAREPGVWLGRWFLILGALGLLLAVLGTALLMRSWARAMRPEMAVRRTVGATGWSIVRLVVTAAGRTGLVGVGVGVVFIGPALWPEVAAIAPGESAWQPGLVLGVSAALVFAAVVAAAGPALRARRDAPAGLWQP